MGVQQYIGILLKITTVGTGDIWKGFWERLIEAYYRIGKYHIYAANI